MRRIDHRPLIHGAGDQIILMGPAPVERSVHYIAGRGGAGGFSLTRPALSQARGKYSLRDPYQDPVSCPPAHIPWLGPHL